MVQLSVSPAVFLRVKEKMALPCLMASLRSASLALRAALMASKAAEAGNLSGFCVSHRPSTVGASARDATRRQAKTHRS
jgi:hypothetical protein